MRANWVLLRPGCYCRHLLQAFPRTACEITGILECDGRPLEISGDTNKFINLICAVSVKINGNTSSFNKKAALVLFDHTVSTCMAQLPEHKLVFEFCSCRKLWLVHSLY